MPLATTVTH